MRVAKVQLNLDSIPKVTIGALTDLLYSALQDTYYLMLSFLSLLTSCGSYRLQFRADNKIREILGFEDSQDYKLNILRLALPNLRILMRHITVPQPAKV